MSGAAEMCLARLEICLALELVSGAASVMSRRTWLLTITGEMQRCGA